MKAEAIQPPIVAFKEWHVVCQALLSGKLSIIFRKGGIAEGRAGFAFNHREFLLFPTHYHAQYEGVRSPFARPGAGDDLENDRDEVSLTAFCRVVAGAVVTDWDDVLRLEPFHLWKNEVLRQRFDYGGSQSIHLALVRTYRLVRERRLPMEKQFRGCRSWVSMPFAEPLIGRPVLEIDAFQETHKDIANLLLHLELHAV